jgi:primosomal protein N'
MSEVIVEVAPAVPLPRHRRQTYSYVLTTETAPEQVLHHQVSIRFSGRWVNGVILAVGATRPAYRLETARLLDRPPLTTTQVALAQWLSATMYGGLGYTLRLFSGPLARQSIPKLPRLRRRRGAAEIQQIRTELAEHQVAYITPNRNQWQQVASQVTRAVVCEQKQVLIVVPEKWLLDELTPLLQKQLSGHYAVVTGETTPRELDVTWQRLQHGQGLAIVGTQKALFLPFTTLGLIIMVEEYYPTHKLWDQYPRLANWYGVQQLAAIHHAPILYASSVSSVRLQALENAGQLRLHADKPAAPQFAVHTFSPSDRHHKRLLPPVVTTQLKHQLQRGQRVAVLYNRHDTKALRAWLHSVLSARYRWSWLDAASETPPTDTQLIVGTSALLPIVQTQAFEHCWWFFPEDGLLYPDFRSRERGWYTLARLSNGPPASRRLSLVTRWPDFIQRALGVSSRELYTEEQTIRQLRSYPPVSDAVVLTIAARSRKQALERAWIVREQVEERMRKARAAVIVHGPYARLEDSPASQKTMQLLLLGSLATLRSLYEGLAISSADLDPYQIL